MEYTISGNTLTFNQDVENWNNGPTSIGSNQFKFSTCTITSGTSITFDFSESTSITVSSCTINKSCTIGSNITSCVYDSDGTLTINGMQSGKSFKFNKINIKGNSIIYGNDITIRSDDHELNIISNKGLAITNNYTLIINNYGTLNINDDYDVICCSGAGMIINNFSTFNLNGNLLTYTYTTVNISDSLFLIETSGTLAYIYFTSTPSTWNGITFTNSSALSGFSKVLVDLNHYFKPQSSLSNYLEYPKQITLQAGEQYFCNKLKNDSEEPLSFELEPRGTLILQPHSSLEVSDHFELPQGSTLICAGETKINDSIIRGESAILLSSELNGRVLNNCNCTF